MSVPPNPLSLEGVGFLSRGRCLYAPKKTSMESELILEGEPLSFAPLFFNLLKVPHIVIFAGVCCEKCPPQFARFE